MNTEIPVNSASRGFGLVFYDADCTWCQVLAGRCAALLARHGFRPMPLQTPGTAESLGVTPDELMARMHLRTADGRIFCGADAFVEIARTRPWSRPLAFLASAPGILPILRRIYDGIASRRRCGGGGACGVQAGFWWQGAWHSRYLGVLPLLTGPFVVLLGRDTLPAWLFMWLLAFAVFAGCKWLTLVEALRRGISLERRSALAYLLGWVGMEPREFARPRPCGNERGASEPGRRTAGLAAGARVALGAILVWGCARWVAPFSPLAAGWLGMIGLILILHFGLFDLLALAWRRAGYPVKPLMNRPTRAGSVGDFWGTRWNRGFHALAHRLMYQPWALRLGRPFAILGVFLGSGLVHDLVISVPARGGYGLPTAYFLLQGFALLFERSRTGRRLHLSHGWAGRIFAIVIVAGPAFWLFPPVFVRNVILPMLHAIGATGTLL